MNTTTTTVILPASGHPLRLACAGFLARYAGKTLDSYRIHLDLRLRWCTQVGLDPLAVRHPHIEIWLRSLEDRHLASATQAMKFGVVHPFYKYAVIDELTDRGPTQNVTRPKIHEGEQKRTWLPTLDCVALLNSAVKAGPREHLFVVLLGQMALRVGEMCALNTDDVHDNQGWRTIVFRGKGGDTYERVIPVQALRDLDRLIDGRAAMPLIGNSRGAG
jgi:integrase/recombinase XerD